MKKRNISLLVLTVALVGGIFTGCGSETVPSNGNDVSTIAPTVETESTETGETEVTESETEEITETEEVIETEEVTETNNTNISSILVSDFKSAVANLESTEDIANDLASNENFAVYSLVTMPVEEGFLNGFDNEITGFNSGTLFSPMIGTIPFVAYVFETDDADTLVETLKSNANLRWNICTEADIMTAEVVDNYVLFAMTPSNIEE